MCGDRFSAGNGDADTLSDVGSLKEPKSGEEAGAPDDLAAVLGRTKESLGKANPVFPPGTFMIAGRHFAPILRSVDRAEAEHLAELAGGVIAVPATEEEADGIHKGCQSLTASDGLWLGGMKNGSLWRWDSGEAWSFARWTRGNDHDMENSALVFVPGAGWKNADPEIKASGFLIEWSNDLNGKPSKQEDDSIAILNKFDPKAIKSIGEHTTRFNDRLAQNAKDFGNALDFCQRRIPNEQDRRRWKPQVEALKKLARNSRIPDAAMFKRRGGIKLTQDMAETCARHFLKQQKYDSEFISQMAVIRDFHVKYLRRSADDFRSKGQIAMANRISAKAEAAVDLDAWLASLVLVSLVRQHQ